MAFAIWRLQYVWQCICLLCDSWISYSHKQVGAMSSLLPRTGRDLASHLAKARLAMADVPAVQAAQATWGSVRWVLSCFAILHLIRDLILKRNRWQVLCYIASYYKETWRIFIFISLLSNPIAAECTAPPALPTVDHCAPIMYSFCCRSDHKISSELVQLRCRNVKEL
jgi:hypothetical protein